MEGINLFTLKNQLAPPGILARLTLSTLDTWSAIIVILVHVITTGRGTSLLPVVGLLERNLVDVHVLSLLLDSQSRRQCRLECGNDGGVEVLRELDADSDVQVAELVVAERGHTSVRDDLERVCGQQSFLSRRTRSIYSA